MGLQSKLHLHIGFSQFLSILLLGQCSHSQKEDPWLSILESHYRSHFFFSRPDHKASVQEKEIARNAALSIINRAEKSIVVFCYGFDEAQLIESLSHAAKRGVRIRIVGSPDIVYSELEEAGFRVDIRTKSGLQHAKAILVDSKFLFSGTGNFTKSGFFHNNNAFFLMELSPEESSQIEAMLFNESLPPIPIHGLPFQGSVTVSPYYGKVVQARIVERILGAKQSIRFLIFSYTDPVITSALAYQARRGVIIQGIIDDSNNSNMLAEDSEGYYLNQSLGLNPSIIYTDGNRYRFEKKPDEYHGGHLHHKTMIIDDSVVLTGSYNWSKGARDTNLEIFYEFRDPLVALLFIEEFERLQDVALEQGRSSLQVLDEQINPFTEPICNSANHDKRLTVFSGRGLFFRAEHFSLPGSACIERKDRSDISAGLLQDSSVGLPFRGNAFIDLSVTVSNGEEPYLCESGGCSFANVHRFSFKSGWVWFENSNPSVSLDRFSKNGWEMGIPLTQQTNAFLTFASIPEMDSILIFHHTDGQHSIACIQSGVGLDGPVQNVIRKADWLYRQRMKCITSE